VGDQGHASVVRRAESLASRTQRLMRVLGPGLITGSSDDDPSGIATYAQAGARFGYASLWTVLVTTPLMASVQETCDRTALATGDSLGGLCRRKYSAGVKGIIGVLLVGLTLANTLNLTADLMAVGQGMNLLHVGPATVWSVAAGGLIAALVIKGSFATVSKVFSLLCLSLLSYIAVLFVSKVTWSELLQGFFGLQMRADGAYWVLVAAIFGTTISPYLFLWQNESRVEELRDHGGSPQAASLRRRSHRSAQRKQNDSRLDVFVGIGLTQVVMFAIITSAAANLSGHGQSGINSAADAAKALQPIAGSGASVLFALGFIGTGVLTVPVLAGAGAAGIAGLLDKPWGLERTPRQAPLYYSLLLVGIAGGGAASLLHANVITMLVLSAVINAVVATPFLIITLLIASDEKLMGKYRSRSLARTAGWATVLLMTLATMLAVRQLLSGIL
jgi:Mn2+/Fe2+ NRAMP family transporter